MNQAEAYTVPNPSGSMGIVFPLSVSECNQYKANFAGGSLYATDAGSSYCWWLRTPGRDAGVVNAASGVGLGGAMSYVNSDINYSGFRPAMWIFAGWPKDGGGPLPYVYGEEQIITDALSTNQTKWRVIAQHGEYKLLVTENVWGVTGPTQTNFTTYTVYNSSNIYTPFESSDLKGSMDTWYNNDANVSSVMRSFAAPYGYRDVWHAQVGTPPFHIPEGWFTGNGNEWEATDGVGTSGNTHWSWSSSVNRDEALTIPNPSNKLVNGQAPGKVFALSISEANRYKSAFPGGSLQATGPDSIIRYWWLRSPGFDSVRSANSIQSGTILHETPNCSSDNARCGFRPAMWVKGL